MKTVHNMFDLTGKVALVTGAGSGLGVVFAESLAEAGASVACADIRPDAAARTVDRVESLDRSALPIGADVSDETSVVDMVRRTVEHFGRLDILVNNAGIAATGLPEEASLDDWQRVIGVNLTGVFLCAREAARAMIASNTGGRIINIASILGAVASMPGPASAYAASKGGVVNLTRDLAVHWAPHNILVNGIGPAYFHTEMTAEAFKDPVVLAAIEQRVPLNRAGSLHELKGVVVFLASDAASYVTGQTIYVDGGWTAW